MRKAISDSLKEKIIKSQDYKCANSPDSDIPHLSSYECLLWKLSGKKEGVFDESGYEIDHIIPFSVSKDDSRNNLHALCSNCHSYKTKKEKKYIKNEKDKIKDSKNESKHIKEINDAFKLFLKREYSEDKKRCVNIGSVHTSFCKWLSRNFVVAPTYEMTKIDFLKCLKKYEYDVRDIELHGYRIKSLNYSDKLDS